MSKPWSAPTTWDEVVRRAAGRAKYHAIRRVQREVRRGKVLRLIRRYGWVPGVKARIARELKVSEATISRDVAHLLKTNVPCPMCESVVHRDRLNPGE